MIHELPLSKRLQMFRKYMLTHSHGGPVPETQFPFKSMPINPREFEREIKKAAGDRFNLKELARIEYNDSEYPMWHISPKEVNRRGKKVIVFSGVHGSETAAIQCIPPFLMHYNSRVFPNINLHIVTPVNPVGAAYESYWNGDGLDINKDFKNFETEEAVVVKNLISKVQPEIILNLHEGPQEGAYMILNKHAPKRKAQEIIRRLDAYGIPLATRTLANTVMPQPGLMPFGFLNFIGRNVLKLHMLPFYADRHDLASMTFESSWNNPDIGQRVTAQLAFLQNALDVLNN